MNQRFFTPGGQFAACSDNMRDLKFAVEDLLCWADASTEPCMVVILYIRVIR